VRAEQLAARETLNARIARVLKGGPLRLAFSGRLIAMKGADHLLDVATELKRLGVPFTLDICGSGDLEPSMRRTIAQCGLSNLVRMRGVLDFKSQLMPFVSSEVDLFVCCHPQGDPSCTYLETMSCGTPMVGYDNEAFRGIVKTSGVGWLSPLGDARALANRIAELNRDRAAIVNAAEQSLAFASQHTFERTMQMRVDHLKRCAGSMRPAGAEVVA
jgi:glycosyltransferase involved in cell wall biosynthesis